MNDHIYCLKCKKFTETHNPHRVTTKNGRQRIEGICPVCKTKKSKFVKKNL